MKQAKVRLATPPIDAPYRYFTLNGTPVSDKYRYLLLEGSSDQGKKQEEERPQSAYLLTKATNCLHNSRNGNHD